MAPTKAQKRAPKAVYGKQTARGNLGERNAARLLRADGWEVSFSSTHPFGKTDLIARKNGKTRRIQVKRISSRTFATADACRNRMRGLPYCIDTFSGYELWVFDKAGHLYKFKS